MVRFTVHDAHGHTHTIEVERSRLDAKRGVLEALAADDADNEVRLVDVGLGALSALDFARALAAAYAPNVWDELEAVVDLSEDAHGPALLEAVEWLGVVSAAEVARASRRADAAPAGDRAAERVAGLRRARALGLDTKLVDIYGGGPPESLLGVLVGGSVVAREAKWESLGWAVVLAASKNDVDSLAYLWHLESKKIRRSVWFKDVVPCRQEDIRLTHPSDRDLCIGPVRGYHEFEFGIELFPQAATKRAVDALRFLWTLHENHGVAIDPTAKDNDAFRYAAENGHLDVLRFLWSLRVDHGVAIDPTARRNEAFRHAAGCGHLDALRFLWSLREDHGVAIDPTARDSYALRRAAAFGHVDVMRFLWSLRVEHGVAIDPTAEDNGAFRYAAESGHLGALHFLWSLREEHGVAIDPTANDNEAFQHAARNVHVDVLRFLWSLREKHGVAIDPTAYDNYAFREATRNGQLDVLRFLWNIPEVSRTLTERLKAARSLADLKIVTQFLQMIAASKDNAILFRCELDLLAELVAAFERVNYGAKDEVERLFTQALLDLSGMRENAESMCGVPGLVPAVKDKQRHSDPEVARNATATLRNLAPSL